LELDVRLDFLPDFLLVVFDPELDRFDAEPRCSLPDLSDAGVTGLDILLLDRNWRLEPRASLGDLCITACVSMDDGSRIVCLSALPNLALTCWM
jgi:hypothetical protein